MESEENLWSYKELAAFLGYSPASVQSMVSQRAEQLPPRVAGLGRPRWVPSIVRAWVIEQSTRFPKAKAGRPRRTPIVE
ncbi:hypothetical protein [Burkholderia ubonensis]|uniref:hypothetical protein n=1 Tax=Burkholderia ubonensis TaxID=101571 RepID=UPI0009B4642B|nr:hypothetical protein [Burkholderia ubonensis]